MIEAAARRLEVDPRVLILGFARMVDAASNSILIVVLPLFVLELPAPWFGGLEGEIRVGLVISLYGFLFAAAQPGAGWLADRLPRKPLIMAGMLGMALASAGLVLATTYGHTLLLRGAQGLTVALVIPATLAVVSDASQRHNRGHAMGVFTTFRMIGFATGPLIGGALLTWRGDQATFMASALSALLGALLVSLYLPLESPAAKTEAEDPSSEEAPALPEQRDSIAVTVFLLSMSTVIMASSLSMIATLESELNERTGQSPFWFGFAFSAFIVARLTLQLPSGRLSDRIGRKPLIVLGLIALSPATMGFAWAASPWQFLGLRIAQGVASAGIAAPAFALAGDLARGKSAGRTMAYVSMGFGAGLAVGPLVTGVLASKVSFGAPFFVVGVASLMVALGVLTAARERPAVTFEEAMA